MPPTLANDKIAMSRFPRLILIAQRPFTERFSAGACDSAATEVLPSLRRLQGGMTAQ